MERVQRGTKHVCFKCSTKFYDLNKPAPVCPACGVDQRENPNPAPNPETVFKKSRPARAPAPAYVPPEEETSAFPEEVAVPLDEDGFSGLGDLDGFDEDTEIPMEPGLEDEERPAEEEEDDSDFTEE